MVAKTVWDLDRNDIAACIEFHDEHPSMTSEEIRVMVKLQDDPAELMEIAKGWRRPAAVPGPVDPSRVGFDA